LRHRRGRVEERGWKRSLWVRAEGDGAAVNPTLSASLRKAADGSLSRLTRCVTRLHDPRPRPAAVLSDSARDRLSRLSDKQREVLEHLILYKSDKEIARDLGISLKTVEQRMAAARGKLGTGDRNETARVYAALRPELQDGGFPLYRDPLLASPAPAGDEAAGAAATASFTLHDAAYGLAAPWERQASPHVLPEVFHGRSATAARLIAIAACAIALLMMALLAIAIGEGLTDLLG